MTKSRLNELAAEFAQRSGRGVTVIGDGGIIGNSVSAVINDELSLLRNSPPRRPFWPARGKPMYPKMKDKS